MEVDEDGGADAAEDAAVGEAEDVGVDADADAVAGARRKSGSP